MAEITLRADAGRPVGSAESRRLRHRGGIPAVVYGHEVEPLPVSVDGRELRTALSGDAGVNALLDLEVAGTNYLVMARELQRHPVKGTVVHVDFQVVRRDQEIAAEVTLTLTGEAIEVAHADGIVDQALFSLPIKAKPADIPPVLTLDISGLTVGSSLRVADIALPDGVVTDLDPETTVVIGVPPRVARADEDAAGEVGAAEGQLGGGSEATPGPGSSGS